MLLSHGRPSGTQLRRSQVGRLERQPGGGEKDVGDQEDETGAGFRHASGGPEPTSAAVPHHTRPRPAHRRDHRAAGAPSPAVSRAAVGRQRQTPQALGAAPDLTPLHKTFQSVRIAITPLGGNFPACRHQWDFMGIQTTAHELGLISPILQMRNQSFRVKWIDSLNRGLLMAPCPAAS